MSENGYAPHSEWTPSKGDRVAVYHSIDATPLDTGREGVIDYIRKHANGEMLYHVNFGNRGWSYRKDELVLIAPHPHAR